MKMDSQELLNIINILPLELQEQVSDFVLFLYKQQKKQQLKIRTTGEYKKEIRIHEDFDKPLPDDFWLGTNK